jgi:parallel beta-helix repeat protein
MTSILISLVFLLVVALPSPEANALDSVSEHSANPQSSSSTAGNETIKERVFSKSRSINATDLGLTAGSTVDQSSALAKAIQHASETPGVDTVYVPEGTYYIAKAIALKPGVHLIGDGPGKTVFSRKDPSNYLMRAKQLDFGDAVVANLTLQNAHRTLLMQDVRNLRFHNVEFRGGIVRFEKSSNIILEGNVFNDNLGKSGYASSNCEDIRIVNNVFNSVEKGSINLSGHKNCYVASNHITSAELIDSGYAGIRLPNSAKSNIVENNFIENHGRGLFILSSSEDNIVRNNTVKNTAYQGVLIQSSDNVLEGNTIIDAGDEAIYVVNADAKSSPTPSIADNNRILGNVIYDTRKHDADRFIGLKILSRNNIVKGNRVSMTYGRKFKAVEADAGNQDIDNVYKEEVRPQGAR